MGAASSDGIPPVWGHRRHGALARTDTLIGGAHQRCDPATFAACSRGVCVPAFLAAQWRTQLGGAPDEAYAAVKAFVAGVLARVPEGPIGDDPLKFWRAQWAAAHGSQAPVAAVAGKGNASRDAMARTIARRAQARGESL